MMQMGARLDGRARSGVDGGGGKINLIRATLNSGKTVREYRVSAGSRRELITTVSTQTANQDEKGRTNTTGP
jgi:hypothetical protein